MERTLEKKQRVIDMYYDGITVKKIAEFFGNSREYIYQILRPLPDFEDFSDYLRKQRTSKTSSKYQKHLPYIKERLDKGDSLGKIVREIHLPYLPISKMLKGTKYDNSRKAKKRRDKKIVKLYKQGLLQREIAQKYGIRQTTVSKIVRENDKV
jgi:transposase